MTSKNPFLLNPDKAGDSNLTNLKETGEAMPSPLESYATSGASLNELAETDTTHIHALKTRADNIINKTEKLVIKEADDLRAVCNTVNAMMKEDATLDVFQLGSLREYVKSLMITLKNKPEFSGILLDRDLANIVQFARQAYQEAIHEREALLDKKEANKEKKAKRASTPKAKSEAAKSAAMQDLDLGDLFK